MIENRNVYMVLVVNPERGHKEDLDVGQTIILKRILEYMYSLD
jgi:hypothetical protein